MATWRVLREPTVPILLLASVMHVVRRNLFDFLLFFGTAVLIVADAQRRFRTQSERVPARRLPLWLRAAGITIFAAAAALAPPASVGAILMLAAVGLMALAVVLVAHRPGRVTAQSSEATRDRADAERQAWNARLSTERSAHQAPGAEHVGSGSRLAGWLVWATLGVAVCLWELASFIEQQVWPADQADHPAASDLIGPLLDTWLGRGVFLVLWAGAGWWLLAHLLAGGARGERSEPGERHTSIDSRGRSQREAGR